MDPLSAVASLATVIAVIGKSVSTLNTIRRQCAGAELRLELLVGQLQSVQSALRQVHLLITDCLALENQHQQLIADLDRSLKYCELLVRHVDNHISKLWAPGYGLKFECKIAMILEDKPIEQYLTMLGHQLSALTLCLTAFKCRTPQEQKRLLDKPESRTILERAEDDASSLIAVAPSSSTFVARRLSVMSTQSQLSKIFAFDEFLLRHKVYQKSFRFMLRRASAPETTEPGPRSSSPTSMSALELKVSTERSERLDSLLKADARKRNSELKILTLGHGRSVIVKQLRSQLGPLFQDEDVRHHKTGIVKALVTALLDIVDRVETRDAGLVTEHSKQCAQVLRQFAERASPEWQVDADVSAAARALWRNWFVQRNFALMNHDSGTEYFLKSTGRILDPQYQPTVIDIVRAPEHLCNLRETKLIVDNLNVDLIEVPQCKLRRIIHQFDQVDACLFNLDLASYDTYGEDKAGCNRLEQSLRFFKAICQSCYMACKPILLCCVNFNDLRRKLATSPLSIHFPDYAGANDATAVANFIVRRCERVVSQQQDLFYHVAEDDAEDQSTIRFFEEKAASLPASASLKINMGLL